MYKIVIEDVGGDAGKIVGPTKFLEIRSQDGAREHVKKSKRVQALAKTTLSDDRYQRFSSTNNVVASLDVMLARQTCRSLTRPTREMGKVHWAI